MKKIFSFALMLLGGLAFLSSCSNDRDSNPTFRQPGTFVLNETNWRSGVFELQNTTDSLILSWSQPDYTVENAPLVVTYNVDFSPKGTFLTAYDAAAVDNSTADYVTFDTQTDCLLKLGAGELNKWIQTICGYQSADDVPANLTVSFRVRATVLTAVKERLNPVTSNAVSISVLPYYQLLKNADPEIWYLIGGDICDGSWGDVVGEKVIPMQTIADVTYKPADGQGKIQWVGYLAGNGFKLRGALDDNWASQWGQGATFGEFVKNDGGSGNITVPTPGLYTVTLYTDANLAVQEQKTELSIEPYTGTATVFPVINISGTFNEWGDTPMNPCFTYDGAENHDWYLKYKFPAGTELKFKDNTPSWDNNWGGTFVETEDGYYGYGSQGGFNFWIADEGTYTILFNDITGYARFIKIKEE